MLCGWRTRSKLTRRPLRRPVITSVALLLAASAFLVGRHCWAPPAPAFSRSKAPVDLPSAQAQASRVLDAAPTAKLAFCEAYEVAIAARPQALQPEVLLPVARRLAVCDRDKARALLRIVDALLTAPPQPSQPGRPREVYGNYTVESDFGLQVAATAALVDRELARKHFARAREVNQHKSEADELLVATADAAILALEGDRKRAAVQAFWFCRRRPLITFFLAPCGLGRESKDFIREVLLSVDPEATVEFASRFDVDFHAETLLKLAELAPFVAPASGPQYYRRASELASDVKENNLRHRILRCAAEAAARDRINEALGLIRQMDFSGAGSQTLGSCLSALAETDLDEAIRLATEWPDKDAARDALDHIARTAIKRDPRLVTRVLPAMDNAHRQGYVLAEAAAELARRGDVAGATELVEMIEPPVRRAAGLAQVATAMADRDKAQATAMLEDALRLGLADDLYGRELADIAARVASVDRARGLEFYRRILQHIFADNGAGTKWLKYRRVVESLAAVDPAEAVAALKRMPYVTFGDTANDQNAASAEILPRLVVADPDMVAEAVAQLLGNAPSADTYSWHRARVREVILAADLHSEETAERFLRLLPGDEYTKNLRRELAELRLVRRIAASPKDAAQLIAQARAKDMPTLHEATVLQRVAEEIAATDMEAAVQFADGIADAHAHDWSLVALSAKRHDRPEEFRPIAARIREPNVRITAWLSLGDAHAREVPGWREFEDWLRH